MNINAIELVYLLIFKEFNFTYLFILHYRIIKYLYLQDFC